MRFSNYIIETNRDNINDSGRSVPINLDKAVSIIIVEELAF